MPFDPSTDFELVLDGWEAVALRRRGGDTTPIRRALRGAARTEAAAAGEGNSTRDAILWRIPQSECPEPPRLGDAIVDTAGNFWTVLELRDANALGRWDCSCRNLAIVHRLDDTITLERATYTKSRGGALTAAWHTWRTGVRARIQPVVTQPEVTRLGNHTSRHVAQRVRVLLVDDLTLDSTFRVRAADGKKYAVVAFHRAGRLDEPHTIEAEALA